MNRIAILIASYLACNLASAQIPPRAYPPPASESSSGSGVPPGGYGTSGVPPGSSGASGGPPDPSRAFGGAPPAEAQPLPSGTYNHEQELANLLAAQTEAIRALTAKVNSLEERLNRVEAKGER